MTTNSIQSAQAYEMHLSGSDQFDIAERLNVTLEEAQALIDEHASLLPSPSQVEARRDEVKRCDVWLSRVNQEYLTKSIPIDKAVTAFCRLSERRCKLLGIDSITRSEVELTLRQISPSSVDQEIENLVLELGINDSSLPGH